MLKRIINKLFPPTFVRTEKDPDGKEYGIRVLADGTETRVLVHNPHFVHEKADPQQGAKYRQKVGDLRNRAHSATTTEERDRLHAEADRYSTLAGYADRDASFGTAMGFVGAFATLAIVVCVAGIVLA